MSRDDGGQAFPITWTDSVAPTMGMTLRDYFAGQALMGSLADTENLEALHRMQEPKTARESRAALVRVCYELADAMIAERAK